MAVALMPDVPDEDVSGRVQDVVKGEGQLDRAQAGSEVAAVRGDHVDDPLADLLRDAGQRLGGKPLQILGRPDGVEIRCAHGPPGARKSAIENRTPMMAPTSTSSGV